MLYLTHRINWRAGEAVIMSRKGKSGLIWLFIPGIIFAMAGLAISYYLGEDNAFICSRTTNKCIIEETNMFGETSINKSLNLKKLAGAEVLEKRNSDRVYTYKLMLITNQGRVSLSKISADVRHSHSKNAKKINAYVSSSQNRLEIKKSGKFVRIIGFIVAGFGVIMLLGAIGSLLKLIISLFITLVKRK